MFGRRAFLELQIQFNDLAEAVQRLNQHLQELSAIVADNYTAICGMEQIVPDDDNTTADPTRLATNTDYGKKRRDN
jgi:hypothetical protein